MRRSFLYNNFSYFNDYKTTLTYFQDSTIMATYKLPASEAHHTTNFKNQQQRFIYFRAQLVLGVLTRISTGVTITYFALSGNAYHWDLMVVGLINGILCIFGLPFMHAVLPHSPLHVKCLADTEEHVEAGHVKNIVVYVRETRLTNLFSNILIGLSLFFLTYALTIIPTAVLDGKFQLKH